MIPDLNLLQTPHDNHYEKMFTDDVSPANASAEYYLSPKHVKEYKHEYITETTSPQESTFD